jgi:hypothetical protein
LRFKLKLWSKSKTFGKGHEKKKPGQAFGLLSWLSLFN